MQIVKIQNPFNLAQSEVFYCLKQMNVSEIATEYNVSPQNLPFICFLWYWDSWVHRLPHGLPTNTNGSMFITS